MLLLWKNLKYLFEPLPTCNKQELFQGLFGEATELKVRLEETLVKLKGVKNPQEEFWEQKHPKKVVLYPARDLPYTNKRIKVDVRNFIQPLDNTIKVWVDKNPALKCVNPLKYDDKIRLFYLRDRKQYTYSYDIKNSSGKTNEVWYFPFELAAARKGDCEDYAHRLKSRLNALGLPDWRSRIACGITRGGIGHSTLYYLADDLKTWVHLNSTTPLSLIPKKLPLLNDAGDLMGIKTYWFSFNQKTSWSTFENPGGQKLR